MLRLTRVCGENHCCAAASEEAISAEYASKYDSFRCLIQSTKHVVKDGYRLSSVYGTGDCLQVVSHLEFKRSKRSEHLRVVVSGLR